MNIKKLLFSFLLVFAGIIAMQAQEKGKKNQKAVIKTSIYCEHCKVCESCGQNFQSNMLKMPGVRMYELDENEKTITVYYNSQKTTLADIKVGISKLGFDADDVKADPIAYDKLDSCCKKA